MRSCCSDVLLGLGDMMSATCTDTLHPFPTSAATRLGSSQMVHQGSARKDRDPYRPSKDTNVPMKRQETLVPRVD